MRSIHFDSLIDNLIQSNIVQPNRVYDWSSGNVIDSKKIREILTDVHNGTTEKFSHFVMCLVESGYDYLAKSVIENLRQSWLRQTLQQFNVNNLQLVRTFLAQQETLYFTWRNVENYTQVFMLDDPEIVSLMLSVSASLK